MNAAVGTKVFDNVIEGGFVLDSHQFLLHHNINHAPLLHKRRETQGLIYIINITHLLYKIMKRRETTHVYSWDYYYYSDDQFDGFL